MGLQNVISVIQGYFPGLDRSIDCQNMNSDVVFVPAGKNLGRHEVVIKLLSTLLGLSISAVFTYFTFRWLINALDPTRKEKLDAKKRAENLMRRIGVKDLKLSEYELCVASDLVSPLDIPVSWAEIGGLHETIDEIKETVILPFSRRDLFSDSSLLSAPKGVLLYGPPGCGKTMIAKATAKASGVRFINLQVSSMLDKWYGESQKRVAAIYSLAQKLQPVIIFIDEIDAFLRSRSSNDHEATAMMKTQFMAFWDGLLTDPDCQILIMGATNRPDDVDAAIMRRMPSKFHIGKPNAVQRGDILRVILEKEPVAAGLDYCGIARRTDGFSGSDLKELCRMAAIYRVRDYLQAGGGDGGGAAGRPLRPMEMADFTRALEKMRQSDATQSAVSRDQHASSQDLLGDFLSDISRHLRSQRAASNQSEGAANDDVVDDVVDDVSPD